MASREAAFFGGRTPRVGFWLGLAGVFVLLLLTFLPFSLLGGASGVCASLVKTVILSTCLLVPAMMLVRISARRLHDIGWTGWPALVLLACVFIEGETVTNGVRYYCEVGVFSPFSHIVPGRDHDSLPSLSGMLPRDATDKPLWF
jgi:uncharacterized membrane protein YhaH (DUF805 family)